MSSPLSTLCLRCGLCCEGALFRFVPVEAAEAPLLQQLGLPFATHRETPVMPLPCAKLEARCCTVYEQRPSGCRAYVCRLGARLAAGEVSVARAHTLVDEARHRVEVATAAWGGPAPALQHASEAAARSEVSAPLAQALARAHGWIDEHLHWPEGATGP